MEYKDVDDSQREEYNSVASHPLQSYEWGEFREATGIKVVRRGFFENNVLVGGFTLTIHKIPKTTFTIGYLPKGSEPTKELLEELKKIGKENNCIFIQLEPNVLKNQESRIKNQELRTSFHPLFTKYTFILDISKSEEELLQSFHSKTRYNIRVAQKHGVTVAEETSKEAFEEYLKLTEETTKRQGFFAHTKDYHKKMWDILGDNHHDNSNKLRAHLLLAKYKSSETKNKDAVLAAWILFTFHNYLYYPYGSSSSNFRNVMASNLIMWEAIKFGKKNNLTMFDMWGALGEEPNPKDSWIGFHNFKKGYGSTHTEFVGSYDYVINPILYQAYKVADKLRWAMLRLKK